MTLLIGLDIGTTRIKAVLLDAERGQIIASAGRETPVNHPREGWSEHDPNALWAAAAGALREVADQLGGRRAAGLAISSLAEAGAPLDEHGLPTYPIIAWYDRRSEPQAAQVEQKITVGSLYAITGQRASPSFGLTKLLWLRDNAPEAFRRTARWLPVPAYLGYRLCGAAACDYTIAARTLLFDQTSADWSEPLLALFDLNPALLPAALPGGTPIGQLSQSAARETGLPAGLIVSVGGHDHLCASFASGAAQPGAVVDSTGSAQALVALSDRFLPDANLGEQGYASYAYVLKGLFALKGGLKAAGSALDWQVRQWSSPTGEPDWSALEADARGGVGRRAGPLWLPHLIGSGTPEGDRASRAALVGVKMEHTRGDLFRAMLEGLACWLRHNLEVMALTASESAPLPILTGGVTRLTLLSQIKADVLNRPLLVPEIPEAAAAGAALLAGLGCRVYPSAQAAARSLAYPRKRFEPDPTTAVWYEQIYQQAYRPLYAALSPLNAAFERIEQTGRR